MYGTETCSCYYPSSYCEGGQEAGEYPNNSEYVVTSNENKEEIEALQKACFSSSKFLYLSKIRLLLMKNLRVGFSGPNSDCRITE